MYAWGNVSDLSGSEMTAGAAGQAQDGLARQAVVLGAADRQADLYVRWNSLLATTGSQIYSQ